MRTSLCEVAKVSTELAEIIAVYPDVAFSTESTMNIVLIGLYPQNLHPNVCLARLPCLLSCSVLEPVHRGLCIVKGFTAKSIVDF